MKKLRYFYWNFVYEKSIRKLTDFFLKFNKLVPHIEILVLPLKIPEGATSPFCIPLSSIRIPEINPVFSPLLVPYGHSASLVCADISAIIIISSCSIRTIVFDYISFVGIVVASRPSRLCWYLRSTDDHK